VQRDRLVLLEAGAEVDALHHASERVGAREADHAFGAERPQPAAVVVDDRAVAVEHGVHLALIGAGVLLDLAAAELRTGGLLPRGIADHPGEVADQEDHPMSEVLEMPHLAQQHRVTEVQVRRGRVEPGLHHQRLAGARAALELLAQLRLLDQVDGAAAQQSELLVDRRERLTHGVLSRSASLPAAMGREPGGTR
jgi:hypothetical protein